MTDAGTFEADVLVVALGADLDPAATPGLVEGGHEFYAVAGAFALGDVLPRFERGPAIIGVTGKSFKCTLAADAYGWVPVNTKTLETNFTGVYAVGDVNGVGTPKAGVFAEAAARVVDHRTAPWRAVTRTLHRTGLLVCRIRTRPGRARGRGLPDRPQTHRDLPGAIRGVGGREGPVRLEPASALVRASARQVRLSKRYRGGWMQAFLPGAGMSAPSQIRQTQIRERGSSFLPV